MSGPDHKGPAGADPGLSPDVTVPVVITRPLEEARVLAEELRGLGREVIVAPVLDIRPVDFERSVPEQLDGLIVTSANGADALERLRIGRDMPVWAVGAATGRRARAAGFTDVKDGAGTAADLVDALKAAFPAGRNHLLWLSGENIRVDLSAAVSGTALEVERRIAYSAVEVDRFDADLSAVLRATQEADIVFFSPRSARRFVRVLGETVGLPHISQWRAVCFSASIADALVEETALAQVAGSGDPVRWSSVTAAEAPTKDALLMALSGDRPPHPTRSDRDGHDEEGDGRMTEKDNSSVTGDDPDKIGAESVTGSDDTVSSPWGSNTVASDTVAAESGDDSLIGGDGNDQVDDVVREDSSDDVDRPAAAAKKSGGGSRFLVTLILIALIGVGLYTTYPVWRQHAIPYAQTLGVTLPPVGTAPSNTPEETAAKPDASAPSVPDSTKPAVADPTPTAPAEVPEAAKSASEPTSTPASPTDDIEVLNRRLDAMAEEIATLKAAPTPVSGSDGDVAGLQARIDDTQRTLSTFGDELAILRDNLGGDTDGSGIGPLAAELSGKLADMGARLEALEIATPESTVSPEDFAKLSDTVSDLSGRLDQALKDEGAARATLSAKLDGIEAELAKLGTAIADTRSDSEQAGAFLIAANQLALASSRSGGFSAELEAAALASADAGGDAAAAIDTLKPLSGGVPSRTVLRDTYPAAAAEILDAGLVGSNDSFVGAALRNVAALVSVRRTTTTGGDSLDELVTSAENAVRAGDLQAAVDTLSRLEGDPAQAAAGWLADAKARLAVDQAVSVLQAAAIANISGG
jgi:uroporphyrinogen-III synthase